MRKIAVPEEGIETLFGSYDENLRFLETLLNVTIRTQGQDLLVEYASSIKDSLRKVYLVHGEEGPATVLTEKLREAGREFGALRACFLL